MSSILQTDFASTNASFNLPYGSSASSGQIDAFSPNLDTSALYPIRLMISDLMGGTYAMRAANKRYLYQEPKESDDNYIARLNRSTLYNEFSRTLAAACGKVMDKKLTIDEATINSSFSDWFMDIDKEGHTLDNFAARVFQDGVAYGVTFIQVDVPKTSVPNGQRSRATDKLENIRPYLIHVPCNRVLGWRHEFINGIQTLTQVRIDESGMVPYGSYGEIWSQRVRILEIGKFTVLERSYDPKDTKKKNPIDSIVDEGTTDLDFIPFVPFYTNQTGRFVAYPPLQNLAELNVKHWQSSSDQSNILKIARVPFLTHNRASNSDDPEDQKTFSLGSGTMLEIGLNEEIKYIEHTGAAISSGDTDIKNIEDQMNRVGFKLVARQTSGDVTATETSIIASEAHAALATFATNLESTLGMATYYMAIMGNQRDSSGEYLEPFIAVNKDYGEAATPSDMQYIMPLYQDGIISGEDVVEEGKRRGLLSDTVKYQSPPDIANSTVVQSNSIQIS